MKIQKIGGFMGKISKNTRKIVSYLANNPTRNTSINQLARALNISVGSAHKILKELELGGSVVSEAYGNSIVYSLERHNLQTEQIIEAVNKEKSGIMDKRTKIVCTIGPATNSVSMILKLIGEGMNVARINGAHGDEESHLETVRNIRKASDRVGILLDLPGTKIRTRISREIPVEKGQRIVFSSENIGGVVVDAPGFHTLVKLNDVFLADDGAISFRVDSIEGSKVFCIAQNSGVVKNRKGVNIPFSGRNAISDADRKMIKFAIKNDVNFIGLSFVREAGEIKELEKYLKGTKIKVISKIETRKAIENYREIIDASYGIMIDRGDLGSEVLLEQIPKLQKRVIKECNNQGKPVIIATQMMHSMVNEPYPTKSEITDVANAVLDGASALMLSAETAVGKYPVETVRMMRKIIRETEGEAQLPAMPEEYDEMDHTGVMGSSIMHIARNTSIDKILCITHGGYTARMISRYRLSTPVIALTSEQQIVQRLSLLWGVIPVLAGKEIDNSASVEQKKEVIVHCLKNGLIDVDDTILLAGAVFPNNRKVINMVEIHKVNEFLGFFNLSKSDVVGRENAHG